MKRGSMDWYKGHFSEQCNRHWHRLINWQVMEVYWCKKKEMSRLNSRFLACDNWCNTEIGNTNRSIWGTQGSKNVIISSFLLFYSFKIDFQAGYIAVPGDVKKAGRDINIKLRAAVWPRDIIVKYNNKYIWDNPETIVEEKRGPGTNSRKIHQ